MAGRTNVRELLENEQVLDLRARPSLTKTAQRLAEEGSLVRAHPRIYVPIDADPWVLLLAASRWLPDGVICGRTAVALHFEQPLSLPLEVACGRHVVNVEHIRIHRHRTPRFEVRPPRLRVATLASSCLEVAEHDQGAATFEALRRSLVRPAELREAAANAFGMWGIETKRELAKAANGNPWSVAEWLLQVLLRRARITGWTANAVVRLGDQRVRPDILFAAEKLILEVDGREFHSDATTFVRDRRRGNALQLAGYAVLHITWEDLCERPDDVVRIVRETLHRRRRRHTRDTA